MTEAKNESELFPCDRTARAALEVELRNTLGEFAADEGFVSDIIVRLFANYSEERRSYHNLSHVAQLLSGVENFREAFSDDQSVRLAVWFHDAVYDPTKSDNEARSAEMAVESLGLLAAPPTTIEKVEKMILATARHESSRLDPDGKLFLDLDLSILGAEAEIYRRYKEAIRREYSFVPIELYKTERARILRNFLTRENIYFTTIMREKFAKQARSNVAAEIAELTA